MKQLSEMSLDELKNQEKKLRGTVGAFVGIIVIMVIAGVILTFQKGFTIFTVMPIIFLPLMTVSINNLKKVKAEISSRNS